MEGNQLSYFLSLFAQGLLIIALPIVIAAAFQWFRKMSAELKQKLTQEQLSIIDAGVQIAVRAAEQAGFAGLLAGGAEKKEYAIKAVQDYLDRAGVIIDVSEIATLIEAEVNKQFSSHAPPIDSPEARSALIDKAVETAVLAAEQSGAKQLAVEAGTNLALAKKEYALDMVQKYLTEHGIKVDLSLLDGMIEAQVMRLKLQTGQVNTGENS
jgi:hypothetical protein